MPRLFTALEIPHDVADDLELLRGGVAGARWVDRDSLHLTLRFIGDVEQPVASELRMALGAAQGYGFELALSGMGAFGGSKPRAIWAGVRRSEALAALQADHESICRRIGLAPEPRQFTPHVTVARMRGGRASSVAVQTFVARHGLYESRPFDVDHFVLLSSRPSKGGGPYVAEEVYELALPAMYSASP
jgi:2'-5' RNA ligase